MHVIIIGTEGSVRSPNMSTLPALGYTISYSPPYFPTERDSGLTSNAAYQKALVGRPLTRGEVGCWMAHHNARLEIARAECHEYHLILEDDADCEALPEAKFLTDLVAQSLGSNKPAILNLFQRTKIVGSAERGVKRRLAPNGGTVGYVFNQAAANLELNIHEIRNTADWPSQLFSCRFYESINFGVYESPSESLVGCRFNSMTPARFYLTSVSRVFRAYSLGIGFQEALWSALVGPLARDLQNRFNGAN